MYLFETSIVSGEFSDCARNSTAPDVSRVLLLLYYTLGSVMLINMLIAVRRHGIACSAVPAVDSPHA